MSPKKKISILGCGWLGIPLAESLLSKGYSVKGSTTTKSKLPLLKSKGIQPFLIQLDSNSNVQDFFESQILVISIPPQACLYLPNFLSQTNYELLEEVIFISSTSVYGSQSGTFSEKDLCHPESPSGKILLETEKTLSQQNFFKLRILRCGGLVGPGRHPGKFFKNAESQGGVELVDQPINLIHQKDVIGIITQVIESNLSDPTQIFNVVSDHHPQKISFYQKMFEKVGRDPGLIRPSKEPSVNRVISGEKLKTELGYSFFYPDLSLAF